jgi:two-component system sensor histidine kinase KdpD
MLFLPAILLAALSGRGPSWLAAALSVAAFDFFFVPPRFTFAVSDTRSLITFAVMFVVGSAMGSLVARLRTAETASREREHRTAALLSFTRDAAAASEVAEITTAVARHVRDVLDVTVQVELPDQGPLHGPLAIRLGDERALWPEQHAFVEAVAHQAGVAIGRLQLAAAARDADVRAKAEALRNALLSSVSHDLRTPLAAITGMATSLRDAAVPRSASEREALDTIVEEARRLSRILTNVLSITKVESGAAPRREWVPLEEIIGSALVRLEDELADRPVTVAVPGAALAYVDPILVELLLLNLLDNASKHTPPGTAIDIAVSREPARAVIEIADRGPGLAPGSFAQVFDKFYRGQTTTSGVGLGLAVCRGIAIAHQGGIEAIPRDPGGVRFVAWFPDTEPMPDVLAVASDDEPIAAASVS